MADSAEVTDAKAQRLVAATLRKGNRIERDNEMYLAIEAFTAEDFHRLVADAGALKAMAEKLGGIDWQTSQNLASAMIGRWLKVDPSTVMTWAPRVLELIPAKEGARGMILDALAAKRPEEMLALVPSGRTLARGRKSFHGHCANWPRKIQRKRAPGSTLARTLQIDASRKRRCASARCRPIRFARSNWPARSRAGRRPTNCCSPPQRARQRWGRASCDSWRRRR
jgi:hypothetical protein